MHEKPLLNTIKEMEENHNIDTEKGIITRKKDGKIIGHKNKKGYIEFGFNYARYQAHRVILTKYLGREIKQDFHCDHINHNPNDNRISNLRELNHQENNQHKQLSSKNTSGYKGVGWDKYSKKWKAQIKLNNKSMHLGNFDTPEEGYEAYKKKALELNKLGHKYFFID